MLGEIRRKFNSINDYIYKFKWGYNIKLTDSRESSLLNLYDVCWDIMWNIIRLYNFNKKEMKFLKKIE